MPFSSIQSLMRFSIWSRTSRNFSNFSSSDPPPAAGSSKAHDNRWLIPGNVEERKLLAQQARDAAADMAVFARVLDATRANLHVMNRLRELRMGRLEYSERQVRGGKGAGCPSTGPCRWGEDAEAWHGNH